MPTALAMINPKFYAWDNETGKPLAYGKVYTYQAGTNIPKATYASESAVTENSNPVILNAAGYADIYLHGSYKIVLKDENDVEVWTADPVSDPNQYQGVWIHEMDATQVSPDTFKMNGNQTSFYSLGRAVRVNDTSYIYGHIAGSEYFGGETHVTITSPQPITNALDKAWVGIISPQSIPDGGYTVSGQTIKTLPSLSSAKAISAESYGIYVRTLGYYEPGDGGANTYELVQSGSGTDDGGSFIDLNDGSGQLKGVFPDRNIDVRMFGAKGDNVDDTSSFAAVSEYASSLATDGGENKGPVILVTRGKYRVKEDTPKKATWFLMPGARITGLPAIPKTLQNDTSRLIGTVIQYGGVDQFSTIRAGDPAYTSKKYADKGFVGVIGGHSDTGAAGVAGTSYTDGSDTVNQSCIGILGAAVNNHETVEKSCWGAYLEAHRSPTAKGNAFCLEGTTFNLGNTKSDTPNEAVGITSQLTYNLWLTTGGKVGEEMAGDSTGAIGILGKAGARYVRGIVFKGKSLRGNEAVAMPGLYQLAWYGGTELPDNSEQKIAFINGNASNPSAANGQIALAVHGASDGSFSHGVNVFNNSLSPRAGNKMMLGDPGRIWTEVYAQNTNIQTSDAREKEQIQDISDAEVRVGKKLKVRKFKWKDSVSEKGSAARWHYGFIAQEVIEAFESEGIDPFEYGAVCYDSWNGRPAVVAENGEVQDDALDAGDRYSLRQSELYALMMAAKFSS